MMKRLPVWRGFAGSLRVRIASTAAVVVLLVAALAGAFGAFSAPQAVPQRSVLATYQQQGQFSYSATTAPGSVYGEMAAAKGLGDFGIARTDKEQFANLVDQVAITYSYSINADQPISQAQEDLSLSMVVSAPNLWQKELPLLPTTHFDGKDLSATAQFRLPQILSTIKGIETEIGSTSDIHTLRLIAHVHTKAVSDGKTVDDTFQQEFTGEINKGILRWSDGADASKPGSQNGVNYTQGGKFGYKLTLLPNLLFADPAPRPLPDGWPIYTSAVKGLDMTFKYGLDSSQPVSNPAYSYQISLLLENTGGWKKQFPLVPSTAGKGTSLTSGFTLDLATIQSLVDDVNKEIGGGSQDGLNLSVVANVSTTGEVAGQPLKDSFIQTIKGNLKSGLFTWNQDNKMTANTHGEVAETRSVPNAPLGVSLLVLRIIAALLLVVAVALAAYLVWLSKHTGLVVRAPAIHRRDEKTRKKYSDVIAAVRHMPAPVRAERVLRVNSLEDLVKVAIDAGHPVLQYGANGRSEYFVIDGSTRFVYSQSAGKEGQSGRAGEAPVEEDGHA